MNAKPDPVEMAADEFQHLLASSHQEALAHVSRLLDTLPQERRYWGGVRLMADHMAAVFDRLGVIDPNLYAAFDTALVQEAARAVLADIEPAEGLGLPVFSQGPPRYLLSRAMAAGGFGSVWMATVNGQDASVAIKTPWVLTENPHAWEDRVGMLREEAAILTRLKHPGIVGCIEMIAEPGEIVYLVTEILPGGTLAAHAKPVKLQTAIRWTAQVADAVDHLRSEAIVHRDLSLGNVGLDGAGNTKVFDFGLAVGVEQRADHEGQRAGTPGFMPPEQVFGVSRELGCRSDVPAVGAMLYEMVTGHSPFPDRATENVAVDWMSGELQQRAEAETVPEILRPILKRCFAYHQEDRYPTAGQLAGALRALAAFTPLQAWWAGRSAGTACVYAEQASAAFTQLQQMPAEKLNPNYIAMALLQGVGVIEELDRMGRLLAALAVELPTHGELLDPRRRIRKPITAEELPVVAAELSKLIQATDEFGNVARQVAVDSPQPAPELFELACMVHSLPAQAEWPDRIEELTVTARFPEALATSLHSAWTDGPNPLQNAIAACDAHAESVLG